MTRGPARVVRRSASGSSRPALFIWISGTSPAAGPLFKSVRGKATPTDDVVLEVFRRLTELRVGSIDVYAEPELDVVVINMKLAADRPGFDVCIEPMPALDIAMRIAGAVARLRRAKDDTLLLRRWEDEA